MRCAGVGQTGRHPAPATGRRLWPAMQVRRGAAAAMRASAALASQALASAALASQALASLALASLALAAPPLHADPLPPRALPALGLAAALPSAADLARPFPDALPARIRSADSSAADPRSAAYPRTADGGRMTELVTCRDWLAQRRSVVGSDSDASWRVLRLQVVPCEAMALLAAATPALHSALPVRFAQEGVTARYPASLWLAPSRDEQARLARPGSTLATASGKARWQGVGADGLKLNAKGWQIQMTLLARGDFDHDGWEDAAFLWQAGSTQGSLADARLVVLTRRAGGGALLDLPVDGLLPAPGR